MTSYPETRPADLSHYVGVLRSHWLTIVGGGAVGLLIAAAVLIIGGGRHTATTDLNINVISADPFNAQRSASGLLDGGTEAQIAGSYAVAARAAEELGNGVTPQELRSGTDVSPIAEATIIRISYTTPSPVGARAGADAIADAYLSYRAGQALQRLDRVVDRIDERLEGLREELADANAQAAASDPGTAEANEAASDRELIAIEIDSLLEEKNALDLIDTSGGSVLSSASENELTFGPRPLPTLLTGLLAGLVLGVIAAFAVNGVRRRVATVKDVQQATGVPVLAHLRSKVATVPAVGSSLEEFRTARERMYATMGTDCEVIALFDLSGSVRPNDVAVNLGLVFAQDGQVTHLVLPGADKQFCDFIIERLALSSGRDKAGGSGYCTADRLFWLHLPRPSVPGAGPGPDELDAGFVREAVARAKPNELVIIGMPAGSSHSSALVAGRLADTIALIIALGTTQEPQIAAILEEPALIDTEFAGAIVVPKARPRVQGMAKAVLR